MLICFIFNQVPEIHKEELVVSPVATAESDVFAEQVNEVSIII